MAGYKQSCLRCGSLIDRDAHHCPVCGSSSPFGYLCPSCLHPIEKGNALCAGCGRQLYLSCPLCGKPTFVQDSCEACGAALTIRCPNKRCGEPQFFQNEFCTACGMKIKEKYRRLGANR
jgi:RNA polymerase subunit RPABC4/transcription elongation factor Spt4